MTDSPPPPDDGLGRKLAEALSLAERLLQARNKDEHEIQEQLDKISAAKAKAAVRAKEKLSERLEERVVERQHAEQIQAVLDEVSELSGGMGQKVTILQAEMNAEREIAQGERADTQKQLAELQASLEAEKATSSNLIEAAREQISKEHQEAMDGLAQAHKVELEDLRKRMESEVEETAKGAARAMEQIRSEVESEKDAVIQKVERASEELDRRVEDLQLLVKVKTEMMEKFEKVLGERDASIKSLIADVEEKGEAMAHHTENMKALRADFMAKEKSAATHEGKSVAAAKVVESLKTELTKVSTENQKYKEVLIERSKTIDELQALVQVLSGDTSVDFAEESHDPVSLPGGTSPSDADSSDVDTAGTAGAGTPSADTSSDSGSGGVEGPMPAPIDIGSLPDVANAPEPDDVVDVLIEEDASYQTGEIARALAAATASSTPLPIEEPGGGESGEDVDVGGWAAAVDADDSVPSPSSPPAPVTSVVEDSVEDAFFGVNVSEALGTGGGNKTVTSSVQTIIASSQDADEFDLGDIAIEEDVAPVTDTDIVQKTDALGNYECVDAEEMKLAGILSHQPWKVVEITKLTKLDGNFVRTKLTEFARAGLIEVIA